MEFDELRAFPAELSLAKCFEQQVAITPRSIAVTCGDRQMTFAELNEDANRLARHLADLGAARDTLVGIALDRTPRLVVAMLAVLKAGAAYLPLDPGFPPERLRLMLDDSQAPLVITESSVRGCVPPTAARIVDLDGDGALVANHYGENLPAPIGGDRLAYVLYTSGSTGRPKGVEVPQERGGQFLEFDGQAARPDGCRPCLGDHDVVV